MPDEEKELTPLEEEREIAEQRPQLTSKQRLWQILLGWASGFLIWFCMALGLMFPENERQRPLRTTAARLAQTPP